MIKQLLEYQKIDADLKKIENTLANSEERKKAMSAKKYLDGVEENVNKLDDKAGSLSATYNLALSEQEKLKAQQEELMQALEGVSSDTEAQFLLKKVEEVIAKAKKIASDISALSNEIQAVMKEYVSIKNSTKVAQAQYNDNGKKYNDLKSSFADEKKKIEEALEEIKKKVDAGLMERYLKKRANKIFPGVYAVSNKVCGACNMELSMSELNKLKNGEVIECDQCGRILYQAE